MKHFIAEKVFIFCGMMLSLVTISQDKPTSLTSSTIETIPTTLEPSKVKNINIDSITTEAKRTVEQYNSSIIKKDKINEKLISLSKQEIKNAKEINILVKQLIKKYDKKNKTFNTTKEVITPIKIDSICTKYKTPLFGKKKCVEYSKVYYLLKGKDTIVLQTIKM